MGRLRPIAWILVLATLGIEGFLWLGQPDQATPPSTGPVRATEPGPPLGAPAQGAPSPPAGDLAGCQAQLAAAEVTARVRAAELRKRLPPSRLFRLGVLNAEAAAVLGPIVDRLLAAGDGGASPIHNLECRDVVCKLGIVTPTDTDSNVWARKLQQRDSDLRQHIDGMSFHVGNPTQDPLTGEGLVEHSVYFRLKKPEASSGAGARP